MQIRDLSTFPSLIALLRSVRLRFRSLLSFQSSPGGTEIHLNNPSVVYVPDVLLFHSAIEIHE